MRTSRSWLGLGLIAFNLVCAAWCSAGDVALLRELSLERCDNCHLPGGARNEPWIPMSFGQPRGYLRRMLAQFKTGVRVSEPMSEVVRQYTEEELDRLSALMAAREPVRIKQATDADKVARGLALYQDRCMPCHTEQGRGSEFDAPLLAGQPLEYLRRQISLIDRGDRKTLYIMRQFYLGLKPDDLDALAQFFASQE